jgi:hypothetical protein
MMAKQSKRDWNNIFEEELAVWEVTSSAPQIAGFVLSGAPLSF